MARMVYEADGTCILWGMGVTQNTGGSTTSAAISNLLLVTGNYRRPGAGAYPLRGHNNVQGACDMATLPNWFQVIKQYRMIRFVLSLKSIRHNDSESTRIK